MSPGSRSLLYGPPSMVTIGSCGQPQVGGVGLGGVRAVFVGHVRRVGNAGVEQVESRHPGIPEQQLLVRPVGQADARR